MSGMTNCPDIFMKLFFFHTNGDYLSKYYSQFPGDAWFYSAFV